jgi:hypothetical protein
MYYRYNFRVKLQLFMTAKSDQDPDGSVLVWLCGSGSALSKNNADPQHWLKHMRNELCGVESA